MSRVLLCVGDPNGIGPEIAVAAASALAGDPTLAPVLVADRHVIEPWADRRGLRVREIDRPHQACAGALDLLPVTALPTGELRPGQVTAAAGAAAVEYVRAAVAAVDAGIWRAIVACPHSEAAVNAAGIPFRGYPRLLAELTGLPGDRVFLMLVGGGLRVTHVTLHESLSGALGRLTPELIVSAGLASVDFVRGSGVAAPRIGVCGINPHAGEQGLFGDEDERITRVAVAQLRAAGVDAHGPLGADLLLAPETRDRFHAHLAMYHDQGHIPVKVLAGRSASAVSLGAGLVFSSVGHGAAFDIAGQGRANPGAVLDAIRLVGADPATSTAVTS
jgi:4-hydroxythreonine-4-phosphate dehydrogenase